jgi:hypothetical protein
MRPAQLRRRPDPRRLRRRSAILRSVAQPSVRVTVLHRAGQRADCRSRAAGGDGLPFASAWRRRRGRRQRGAGGAEWSTSEGDLIGSAAATDSIGVIMVSALVSPRRFASFAIAARRAGQRSAVTAVRLPVVGPFRHDRPPPLSRSARLALPRLLSSPPAARPAARPCSALQPAPLCSSLRVGSLRWATRHAARCPCPCSQRPWSIAAGADRSPPAAGGAPISSPLHRPSVPVSAPPTGQQRRTTGKRNRPQKQKQTEKPTRPPRRGDIPPFAFPSRPATPPLSQRHTRGHLVAHSHRTAMQQDRMRAAVTTDDRRTSLAGRGSPADS